MTNIADAQNKAITLNCRHLGGLFCKLQDVANYTNTIRCSVDTVFKSLKSLYTFGVMEQALAALETGVTSILKTNNQIIQILVDASRGRVTSNLFPFQDLHKVLHVGAQEHKLTPLFDLPLLHHYYPLITSIITSDAIVIHVNFKSEPQFEVYRLEPFPFLVNGATMTLDLPACVSHCMLSVVIQTYRLLKQNVSRYSFVRLSCLLFCLCLMASVKWRKLNLPAEGSSLLW